MFAWQRRRARAHGIADPHCGAVTFVQRFGSMLNLTCHAHALVPGGVFAANSDGSVLFHPLSPPWDDDVAKVLEQIARAIHRVITRYLAARGDDDPLDLLATEQAQTVAGLPARDVASMPTSKARRSAFLDGHSLHADRLVDEADRDGLERLCRYGARSPVANSRLSLDPSGRVVLSFKRSLRDGRAELAFTPIDFLRRLATLIPPPFANLTRYHGVFAHNHHLRAAIVLTGAIGATASSRPASRRRLDWASLLKCVFATDVLVCDACGGAMRILAILPDGDASHAILEYLRLPTEPPAPGAVGPPEPGRDDALA